MKSNYSLMIFAEGDFDLQGQKFSTINQTILSILKALKVEWICTIKQLAIQKNLTRGEK